MSHTHFDSYENNDKPGVVTGLAWTQAGGEILFIESALARQGRQAHADR